MKVLDASLLTKGFKSKNNVNDRQYSYDKNGNMTGDVNKEITSIEYNYLNLPQKITFGAGGITTGIIIFVYDASGVKLRKIVQEIHQGLVMQSTTYDYVNGVEYKNNSLERIANTEGAVTKNSAGVYQYEYVLRDHLGNTRATFSDANNDGTVTSADIKQINHYYPFGLNMEGNWTPSGGNGEGNKYQYNGKELNEDFGLNWNDYGARFYDAAIGRWNAVDPLADKYYTNTPYNYVLNNPINFVDPDGREVDVSSALKDPEGFYALVNTMLDLSEMTGMALSVQKGKLKESDETLGEDNLGGSTSARTFLRHLMNDKDNNIEFKQGALPGGVFGQTDQDFKSFTVDGKKIDDIVSSLGKAGISKVAYGFGATFLHEAMHTSSGSNYYGNKDHFNHFTTDKNEDLTLSRIEKNINVFRREIGSPEIVSTASTSWNALKRIISTTWIVNGTQKVVTMQKNGESAEERNKRVNNFNNQNLILWVKPK